ncbi:MAG: NFACT RNA binding domain-containing protein [Candidatus Micrarchaeia archaeon]
MEIKINLEKRAQENAAEYYQEAKKARKKKEGVLNAIKKTRKKLREVKERGVGGEEKQVRVLREKKWYEKFGWSFTNSGKLILFGRNAKQNDALVSSHLEKGDLFLHADIKGGSATILKGGETSEGEELEEATSIAASFSKAWTKGFSQVDVYAVEAGQVSKHAHGGAIESGGFALEGERRWYRNTPLKLRAGIDGEGRAAVGAPGAAWIKKGVEIVPGRQGKGKTAKMLGKLFQLDENEFVRILPSGTFRVLGVGEKRL